MPVSETLPPFPNCKAFDSFREVVESASNGTDKSFIEFCVEAKRSWSKLAQLLSADQGLPSKKLKAAERAEKRRLEAAGVSSAEISALLHWFDDAIQVVRLSHARAA